MNITITGRHMEMTEALKTYIEAGLGKIESYFDRVIDADVVLDVEKHRHLAEVNLHANGVRIHGRESSNDMYASVDAVIAKLERQVKKYKGRISKHKARATKEAMDYRHAIISVPAAEEEEPHAASSDDNGVERVRHEIVHHEKLPMRSMSVDEAVMQLELAGDHPFLVFSNADTSRVNVLYAREDGTFGLIEPQF